LTLERKIEPCLPPSQIWQRGQEISQQRALVGLVPIEGIERTNAVVVWNPLQGKEEGKDLYVIDVDRERNYYSYRGFSHLA